jgi:cold shock CspA family protein
MIGRLLNFGDRGFGFFRHADGYGRTFVHKQEFERIGIDMPSVRDTFEFDIIDGRDGRPCAGNLRLMQ